MAATRDIVLFFFLWHRLVAAKRDCVGFFSMTSPHGCQAISCFFKREIAWWLVGKIALFFCVESFGGCQMILHSFFCVTSPGDHQAILRCFFCMESPDGC